jgi:hypothetical protein
VKGASISSRLIVGAVLVLAAVAVADALRPGPASDPLSSPRETVSIPEIQHPGGRPEIERIGAEWARRFASNGLDDCYHTGQELCEHLHCIEAGGHKVASCRLPTHAYRRSFRAAAVDAVLIEQFEALARLSNGELIRLHADGGTWWVLALGLDVGRGFFEKPG